MRVIVTARHDGQCATGFIDWFVLCSGNCCDCCDQMLLPLFTTGASMTIITKINKYSKWQYTQKIYSEGPIKNNKNDNNNMNNKNINNYDKDQLKYETDR